MLTHTLYVLRRWGEDDLAMALTNATIAHDPSCLGAVAAGWME